MTEADTELTVCQLADIPEGRARGFRVAGVDLLALRERNCIHLYLNRCPHLGIPLDWDPDSFLDNEGTYIRCANHGALFLKDSGECIQGPCPGQSLLSLPFHIDESGAVRIARSALQGLA